MEKKILAVKLARDLYKTGLRDAKNLVDLVESNMGVGGPQAVFIERMRAFLNDEGDE